MLKDRLAIRPDQRNQHSYCYDGKEAEPQQILSAALRTGGTTANGTAFLPVNCAPIRHGAVLSA